MPATTAELLETVRSWHRDLGAGSKPQWDDLEIVVRLGVTDERIARTLLLADLDALMARWSELRGLVGADPPATETEPADEAELAPSRLGGAARERFRVLKEWLADAVARGQEVDAVTQSDLVRIAESEPADDERTIKTIPQLRTFREGLADLLARAQSQVPADDPEPDPPAPEPGPPQPVDSGTPRVGDHAEPSPAVRGGATRRTGPASAGGFVDFVWPDTKVTPPPVAKIEFSATGSESLRLTWPEPPVDGLVRIYRVLTNNTYHPASPKLGDLVVTTYDCEAIDEEEFTSPVRHVAVWVNTGATEEAARAAQPTLYAAGVCVLPVRDLVVRNDEGTVLGKWRAIEGLKRVEVFRVPIELAQANPHYDVGTKLDREWITQGGFKDPEAPPGAEYEYRVYAVAEVAEAIDEMAPFVARSVRLEASVQGIDDLTVTPREDSENTYDLSLTIPPQGTVEIYRSAGQPPSGIGAKAISRSALTRAGFTPDLLLGHGLDVVGTRGSMNHVPWPKGWSRAYFTPVTVVSDEQIRVGKHAILTRSSPVSHVRLVERVDEQFLTFAWPDGVTIVKVYQGPSHTALVDPDQEVPIHELSHEDYKRYGGAHLRNPLPREGCSVHIVATSFTMGEARHSAPVTVQYRGLVSIHYDLKPVVLSGRRRRGAAPEVSTLRQVVLQSSASSPIGAGVRVALVHNAHRLPLHLRDGQEIEHRQMNLVARTEMVFHERVDVAGRRGFLRLFIEVPQGLPQALAVLDPPVHRLRCP